MKKQLFLFFLMIMTLGALDAQTLQEGVDLYGAGRWREAVTALRRVQGADPSRRSEALYWIFLSELAAGEYEASLRDMEELERADPGYPRMGELPYHKGRALFYLGRYDEAAALLRPYADGIRVYTAADGSRKAAALYWIGECLFALGRFDEAREVFTLITREYPQSVKFEAASYRIALIDQKKIEAELLTILKWSHEESLKTSEDYRRREFSYDQAIAAYQKRIADMIRDPLPEDAAYPGQLPGGGGPGAPGESRAAQEAAAPGGVPPEAPADIPAEVPAAVPPELPAAVPALPQDRIIRLLTFKAEALDLTNKLSRTLNTENGRVP
jgi:tetratricopeptide (TPR) repeat protein